MPSLKNEREKMLLAMLFASGESVPVSKLASALGLDIPQTRGLLLHMSEVYLSENSALMLREVDDSFKLCTNPAYHHAVERLIKQKPRRALSQPMLETLAIVAFKQPVTRPLIENIRGVNSDHSVNKLIELGLVQEVGRLDAPGRPILFGTTEDFLLFYGLANIGELKSLNVAEEEKTKVKLAETSDEKLPAVH